MNLSEAVATIAERLQATTVRAVFGDPLSAHGRTIVPVARVTCAFGGGGGGGTSNAPQGSASDRRGEGAGGGGAARAFPAGFIEITQERARFISCGHARSTTVAALVGLSIGILLGHRWLTGKVLSSPTPNS